MKRCPECSNTFPDSEQFCSSDGAQLVPAEAGGRATVQMPSPAEKEPAVECPVCGGKALPGEELCSFCGARLGSAEAPPPQPSFTIPRQTVLQSTPEPTPGGGPYFDDEQTREPSGSRRVFAFTGYLVAAIVALVAGAWFALHLTHPGLTSKPAASAAAPAASPAITGPVAQLASNSNVQVTGESTSDPARNTDAATKLFKDNSAAVLDLYKKALAGDSNLSDGVLASATVNPAGSVIAGSVKTSTTPNPALDADLVKTMMGWHFAPFSGSSVEVSYPVVMARNAEEKASVESALADKIAKLNPTETPEYASAPAVPPGAPSPAAEASTGLAATEPITPPSAPEGASSGPGPGAPAVGAPGPEALAPVPGAEAPAPGPYAPERPRRRRRREGRTVAPPPRVDLLTRVEERLRNDRRLGRVKAYTNGGGVVTLYGKVFDDRFRRLAVSTVKSVDGVTDVIDSLQTDTAAWAQQESAIAAQLQGAGLSQVSVKVIGHDAYLSGQVSTEAQKEHAVTIAEGAAPVQVRTNLIRVVPRGVFSF